MTDSADFSGRTPGKKPFLCGVVEGFYGRPWSTEQRYELFKRMKRMGMNMYLYAPKDDVKHRAHWRDLYSIEEAEELQGLIEAARKSDIIFVYALSPGIDMVYSSNKDVGFLKKKLDQLVRLGCKSFSLLFDDIEPEMCTTDKEVFKSFAECQVSVTNKVFEYLSQPQFIFCPTEYCASRAVPDVHRSQYLEEIGNKLLPAIEIMWTGPNVISKTISIASVEALTAVLRRPPLIWDNIHANDYDRQRLFLGPYEGRSPQLIPHLSGVLTNPNCEFEANYVAMHTLAMWSMSYCSPGSGAKEDVSAEGCPVVESDVKLETEEEPILDRVVKYDSRAALRKAVADWLPEFYVPRSADYTPVHIPFTAAASEAAAAAALDDNPGMCPVTLQEYSSSSSAPLSPFISLPASSAMSALPLPSLAFSSSAIPPSVVTCVATSPSTQSNLVSSITTEAMALASAQFRGPSGEGDGLKIHLSQPPGTSTSTTTTTSCPFMSSSAGAGPTALSLPTSVQPITSTDTAAPPSVEVEQSAAVDVASGLPTLLSPHTPTNLASPPFDGSGDAVNNDKQSHAVNQNLAAKVTECGDGDTKEEPMEADDSTSVDSSPSVAMVTVDDSITLNSVKMVTANETVEMKSGHHSADDTRNDDDDTPNDDDISIKSEETSDSSLHQQLATSNRHDNSGLPVSSDYDDTETRMQVDPPADSISSANRMEGPEVMQSGSPNEAAALRSDSPELCNSANEAAANRADSRMRDDRLSVDDVLLICELFYLPYQHGEKGVEILSDLNWLRVNVASVKDKRPKFASKKMIVWKERAEAFYRCVRRVSRIADKLFRLPNRSLSFDLCTYVWDMRAVLSLLQSFVKWLESTAGGDNYRMDDAEPWVFRGGLTGELQRMLPMTGAQDLFANAPPLSTNVCTLRPYLPSDEKSVYEVCLQTCDDRSDGSHLFTSCPDLIGDKLVGDIITLSSRYCFVIEDDYGFCGYALAALDYHDFLSMVKVAWLPAMREKYPLSKAAGNCGPVEEIISSFHQPDDKLLSLPPSLLSLYPSFIRLDLAPSRCYSLSSPNILLPGEDTLAVSRRTLACLLNVLKAGGSRGAHCRVRAGEKRTVAFYLALGFTDIGDGLEGGLCILGRKI